MLERAELLKNSWVAINLETMLSLSWAESFRSYHDLKFDEYKQIVYTVIAQCACYPQSCTLSHIQKTIANAYSIDQKTVATRIQRLVDENFLRVVAHPTDRRKKLVEPTDKLIVLFGKFSERAKSIVNHVHQQITTNPLSGAIQSLESDLYFDVLKEVDAEYAKQARPDERDEPMGSTLDKEKNFKA